MTDSDSLRGEVAAQLVALSAAGQPLNTDAAICTAKRYAGDASRFAVRKHLIGRYLERQTPRRDGRSAIITAGAPGAGKTRMLHTQVCDLDDYRILDADIVKDYLIEQALEDGIYDDLLDHPLADGHSLAPGELAALVHRESAELIDRIRKICVDKRENIVVEGTLSWKDQGRNVFGELAAADYSSVQVLGIEADRQVAHEQALSRWWGGRRKWAEGADVLGGRFTPPDAIDSCYGAASMSRCAEHALALIDLAQSGEIASVQVTIFRRAVDGALEGHIVKEYRR